MTTAISTSTTAAFKTLARIQHALPAYLAIQHQEIDVIDGYPTSTMLSGPPGSSGVPVYIGDCMETASDGMKCFNARPCAEHDTAVQLTSVESAASQLTGRQNILSIVARKAKKIEDLAADLERTIARGLPKPEPVLCNGGRGRDGHMEGADGWGTTDCGAHVDAVGMCNRHIGEERVWRAAHNLPEREIERPYLSSHNVAQDNRGRFTAA